MTTNLFAIPWHKLQRWSPAKQHAFQAKKLRVILKISELAPYYNTLYQAHNMNIHNIRSLDDFASFPFTTKADLLPSREHPEKASAFVVNSSSLKRDMVSEFKPVHVHFTSGRSAMSIPVFYTQRDLLFLQEAARRMMGYLQIPHTVRVINVFPYAPHLAFWQTVYATNYLGIFGLHTGGGPVMGTERIVDNIEKMHAECIVGIPSYVYHLLSYAVQHRKKLQSVKWILVGGEAITHGYIEKLKHLLMLCDAHTVQVYSTYAFTEGKVSWSQCHEESGYHLYPDMEFVEIINHQGKRVPDGQIGEIVYTALDFRGTLFLRYKTGDIGRLQPGSCPHCGCRTPRLEPSISRSTEIISLNLTKIKGTLVDLHAVAALLSSLSFIDEWQLFIQKKKKYDLDDLVLHVAPTHDVSHHFVKLEIMRKMNSNFHITPTIRFKHKKDIVKQLELEHRMKEKRIVDLRNQKREHNNKKYKSSIKTII
ncbi:MAG: AMP-binding protein [Nanoarchaeota archaeon]